MGNHSGACPTGKTGQQDQPGTTLTASCPRSRTARTASAQRLWPRRSESGQVPPPSACHRSWAKESAVVLLHTPAAQFSVSASIVHGADVASLSALCDGVVGAGGVDHFSPVAPTDTCRPGKRAGGLVRVPPRCALDRRTGDPSGP